MIDYNANEPRFSFEIQTEPFEVASFSIREEISTPYEIQLTLTSKTFYDLDALIGKEAVLTIGGKGDDRLFHGIINYISHTDTISSYEVYEAVVGPQLHLTAMNRDFRIFQNKDVKEIVSDVLKKNRIFTDRFEFRTTQSYEKRVYCVQYKESDLTFISRLLEEEGIFYYFEHFKDRHMLYFGDSTICYLPISEPSQIAFKEQSGLNPSGDVIFHSQMSYYDTKRDIALDDYNFIRPTLNLQAEEGEENPEHYHYPGRVHKTKMAERKAKILYEEGVARHQVLEGESTCQRFIPGYTFTLCEHPEETFAGNYLLVRVAHKGEQPQVFQERVGGGKGATYVNEFDAIPEEIVYRAPMVTPHPKITGAQTAIVTGPKGEEIYTDRYGRVKVKFHWDREGGYNEKSSCWIRVATSFAGHEYGTIRIPRIGHEVIVEFFNGDPDYPVITGSVYNAATMPPYDLPDEKTKSTIKSHSTIGGEGFNEIRFEDAKGMEQLFIHAQKDYQMRIKNRRREIIENDSHLNVERDRFETIENSEHTLIEGDDKVKIARDYNQTIDGNEDTEIKGNRHITIGGQTVKIYGGNLTEEAKNEHVTDAASAILDAASSITLKVGGNFIKIDASGVTLKGTQVKLNSGGQIYEGPKAAPQSPLPPVAPAIADTANPGKDPERYEAPSEKPQRTVPELKPVIGKTTYVPTPIGATDTKELETLNIEYTYEDGTPVADTPFELELPNGTIVTGRLDEKGKAQVKGKDVRKGIFSFVDDDEAEWND